MSDSHSLQPSSARDPEDGSFRESGLKQESTERIFRLFQFLTANGSCTRKEIFSRLARFYRIDEADPVETTTSHRADRMLERDLQFLKDVGYEIERVRKGSQPTIYRLVKGSGPQAAFLFTETEVDHLAILYMMFADPTRHAPTHPAQPLPQQLPRNPFADKIIALIERLVAALPDEQRRQFDRWARQPFIYFNFSPVTDYLPYRETVDTIVKAISQNQQIRFTYLPARGQQKETTHEHIDPCYILYLEGHFYLIGYHHEAQRFLEYRIDRIKSDTLRPEPDRIDTEHIRRPITFRFWIDSSLVKPEPSRRWLTQTPEREEIYIDEQGRERRRILVRATAYSEWRILQQLLRYGDKAELIEPASLREQMREVVRRMGRFYGLN